MANIKISELIALVTLANDDVFPLVDDSANQTKKISYSSLKTNLDSVYSGIKSSDETITVGSGKDFATIQEAIDSLTGFTITDCTITIDVDAGSYDEAVEFDSLLCAGDGTIKLEGDTRDDAGKSFTCTGNIVDNGDGTATITLASSPTAGWEDPSDSIIIKNCTTAGNDGEYPIVSRSGAAITYTTGSVTGEAVLTYTTVTLKPTREIARTSAGPCILVDNVCGVVLDGWHLDTHTGTDCHGVMVINGGIATCNGVSIEAEDYGGYALGVSSVAYFDLSCSAIGCSDGFLARYGGMVQARYSVATGCTNGYYSDYLGLVTAQGSYAYGCTAGFRTQYFGVVDAAITHAYGCTYGYQCQYIACIGAYGAAAHNCTVGYYAYRKGYIYAVGTDANNSGNSTDYSPAVSDTEGNIYSVITWS